MARWRGCIWLTAGLVLAILAGAVAFTILEGGRGGPEDQPAAGEMVDVVVATQAVQVRALLTEEDVAILKVPVDTAPEGAVPRLEDAVGRITLVDLYPGEILLAQRLVDPNVITGDGRLALVVAEDQVLMAFPVQDLMSRIGVLKPGDHVDLLFSLNFPTDQDTTTTGAGGGGAGAEGGGAGEEEQVTFNLLQNVTVAAIVGGTDTEGQQSGAPTALLFTVSPQDALLLKYAKDAGGIVDIVLRAPGVEDTFDTDPVDVEYMMDLYRIFKGR